MQSVNIQEIIKKLPSAWWGLEKVYKQHLPNIKINKIIEIGVGHGFSLFNLAKDFPDAIVIGVDHFCGGKPPSLVVDNLQYFPNCKLLQMYSEQAAQELKDEFFDLIHIDAEHTPKTMQQDFDLWQPKLNPGGCMMFHDVNTPDFAPCAEWWKQLKGKKFLYPLGHGLGFWYSF